EMLDAAANLTEDAGERDVLRFRAAQVLEAEQRDALGAIDRYRAILDENPSHAGARGALEKLLGEEETREAAAAVLEPLYRRAGEHGPLCRVLEVRLAGEGDAAVRRQLLGQIGELHEL